MPDLRIAIVGCGTAGPAAALMLARQGYRVTLFDKAPALNPVGAGLLLQPSGLNVLRDLGLLDQVHAAGSVVRALRGRLPSGKVVLELHYADLRADLYGVGIGRGSLLAILLNAATAAGAALRPACEVTGISGDPRQPVLLDAEGNLIDAFDLVLICDGSRSTLGATVGIPTRTRTYGWGALWSVGRITSPTQPGERDVLEQVYHSTTTLIGTLPSGTHPQGGTAVSLFYSAPVDRFEAIRHGNLSEWARRIQSLHPVGGQIAAQTLNHDGLLPAVYREVIMPRWHQGRICVLGDAGHAQSPLLGMGANMALIDAQRFTESVQRHGPDGCGPAYSASRRDSIRIYQRVCRWMTPMYQSGLSPLAIARNAAVPMLCKWGWSRRHALNIVAGVQTGLLSAHELPPTFDPVNPLLTDQR